MSVSGESQTTQLSDSEVGTSDSGAHLVEVENMPLEQRAAEYARLYDQLKEELGEVC